MNPPRLGRTRTTLAAALLVATGTLSLIASARQAPPSPAQAKKSSTTTPASGKQVGLPNLGQSPALPGGPGGVAVPIEDPQKQGHLDMDEGDLNEKTGIARGKNFIYTEGDMKVTGQTAVYNKNTKELDAQGSLDMDDPKHHVNGDKSHIDRKKQTAAITGSVVITLKPSPPDPNAPDNPDRAKQRQYPVIITCDRADDAYKKEFIVLQGHLVFKQKVMKDNGKMVERTMTAEHAEYDGKANKLHLYAPVHSSDSDNQKSDFEKDVFVGTKEGEETLSTPGKLKLLLNTDDANEEDQPTADPPKTDSKTPEKSSQEQGTTPAKKDTPPPPAPK